MAGYALVAQDISFEKKVISIEELIDSTVSIGSFLDLDIKHSPVSISVITADQIQNSGARHLSELLEIYVPGFQYMYNKWNGIIWGMRGVAADRNTKFIFLVNGHKMNTESRDGAFSELNLGFLSDLEKVEVLRGPSGLVYGSGSIGGVINLVTKRYIQDKRSLEAGIETWSLKTGGTTDNFSVSEKLNNGGAIQLYGGIKWSQGSGMETPHIFGRPSWPSPQTRADHPTTGIPATGSSWDTPGNFIFSSDYQIKNWRAYARVTHQVTNAAGMFVLDPWPEIAGVPDSTASPRMVDGKLVSPLGFWGQTEGNGNNRRQYKLSNITIQINKDFKLNKNPIKLNCGVDLVSSKITVQKLPAYNSVAHEEIKEIEAFGERRFNLTGTYIINRKSFQIATGIDSRLFVFGKDLAGKNSQQEKANHPIIANVMYFNQAIFSEAVFFPDPRIMLDMGIRYDLHTRTVNIGGFINSRLGMVYTINQNSNIRLTYQSSGNNGSADNYEPNRNIFNDQGEPYQEPHYEVPTVKPNENSTPIEPVSTRELRALKPEKAYSWELSSIYEKKNLRIHASVSYNTIKDLFAWNQASFRVINIGRYHFANGEIELQYNIGKLSIGLNHVISRLVNTDVLKEGKQMDKLVFKDNEYNTKIIDGQTYYYPVVLKNKQGKDSTTQFTINPVSDGISIDGKNFLNLASNISKAYVDFSFNRWFSVHSDWRLFWGLRGRSDIIHYNPEDSRVLKDYSKYYQYNSTYPYLDIDRRMIVKWNIAFKLALKNSMFQLFIYDILSPQASSNNIHSIRWQQMSDPKIQTDLYSYDFKSYALKVTFFF
ncbi:TonB-dependent receptor plug domain-containing protein [Sporocytophaga myxococcoides]|uniref:TonB-dependent receptor plug domain-containing protein n=1 Tax=Sporocytophaga myxococcoides TaxID=153721 RepID=UPI0005EDC4C7|nr:TonB-dependent receptor [Sporocytophaga myxococcoides]